MKLTSHNEGVILSSLKEIFHYLVSDYFIYHNRTQYMQFMWLNNQLQELNFLCYVSELFSSMLFSFPIFPHFHL